MFKAATTIHSAGIQKGNANESVYVQKWEVGLQKNFWLRVKNVCLWLNKNNQANIAMDGVHFWKVYATKTKIFVAGFDTHQENH